MSFVSQQQQQAGHGFGVGSPSSLSIVHELRLMHNPQAVHGLGGLGSQSSLWVVHELSLMHNQQAVHGFGVESLGVGSHSSL